MDRLALVEDLENVFKPLIKNSKITSLAIKKLTVAGENFGSLMLSLEIGLHNDKINIVAKLPPPNEFIQKLFNIPITFRNEVGFYATIIPVLKQFEIELDIKNKIDSFPKFYGGDSNVLLLENLKIKGYKTLDKTQGFNLPTTKVILQKLAELHGLSVAFKHFEPQLFDKKLAPLFVEFTLFDMNENMKNAILDKALDVLAMDKLCFAHLSKFRELLQIGFTNVQAKPRNSKEFQKGIFQGLIHCDLWVNNVMVNDHDVYNREKIAIKFVDFQLYQWGSIARDLIFFLFSSVELSILEDQFDELIKDYYNHFIKTLKNSNYLDRDQFSLNLFLDEIKYVAKYFEFYHLMLMMEPIFAVGHGTKEIHELSEEDFKKKVEVSQKQKNRTCYIGRQFIKRNWL